MMSVGWDQDSPAATGAGVIHVVPCAGLGRRPDAVLPRLRWTRGGSALELPKDTPAGHPGASQVSLVLGKWQAALAATTGQILGRRVGRSWEDAGRIVAGSADAVQGPAPAVDGSTTGATAAAGGEGVGSDSGHLQARTAAVAAPAAATEGDVPYREAAGGPVESPPAAAAAAAHAAGQQQAAAPAAAGACQAPAVALAAHHRQQQQGQQQGLAAGRGAQGGGGSTSTQASGTGGVPGLQLERPLGEVSPRGSTTAFVFVQQTLSQCCPHCFHTLFFHYSFCWFTVYCICPHCGSLRCNTGPGIFKPR